MTQAFNLGLLANNVNSSGKLDGTTGLTTSIVANTIGSAASTALTLQSAGTTAITVDTSQNVGIGTSSPSNILHINKASGGTYLISSNGSGTGAFGVGFGGEVTISAESASNIIRFLNNSGATERMRIDSSGVVLVNTSSPVISGYQMWIKQNESAANYVCLGLKTDQTSNRQMLNFVNGNGLVGTINTSGSATTYNTSSDYRLKENITPMTGALAKVAQLKPVKYKWKVDGADGEGFIAHELAEVCPHAVSGEKDAVDAEGNPQYQGIDVSFLVATLTAALQETKALIDTQAETINALTARIVALESK